MKTIKNVSVLLMVGFFSFLLFSCNKDDDPSSRDLLVGDWDLDRVDGDKASSLDFSLRIEVENDGDYTERWVFDGFDNVTYRGEWKLDNNTIEIEYDDGDRIEFELKEVNGSAMTIEDDDGIDWEFERD